MTILPNLDPLTHRTVLLSHAPPSEGPRWLRDFDDELRPAGFVFCRAHSGPDTIRRVEQGRLAAAVLVEDRQQIDGLSLLRIIRSIDLKLPCWLVTEDATRQMLQAALSLSVAGVMTHPIDVAVLAQALRKLLSDPNRTN